jgi:hypothetical protein
MGIAWGWSPALHGRGIAPHKFDAKQTTNKSQEETAMYGIEFDPQTTSDYWAHYLRVMKEAKTR